MEAHSGDSWSRQRFAALLTRPEEAMDLAEGALLIACEEYPELELEQYLSQLDRMGSDLAQRLDEPARAEDVAAVLNGYLFEEQGFRGNAEAYYDPRNSFLNEVLDRRTGIPISLSAVYMEVARRAGLTVLGVGLPGHFVVRLVAGDGEVLVDPFHAGAVLTPARCQERLDRIFGGRVKMEPRMLEPVTARQILERMLRNLKAIYAKEEDHERGLRVIELLLRLRPANLEDVRDRGLVYAALDCYALATRDLEAYLARTPPGKRTAELRETVEGLKRRAARLH